MFHFHSCLRTFFSIVTEMNANPLQQFSGFSPGPYYIQKYSIPLTNHLLCYVTFVWYEMLQDFGIFKWVRVQHISSDTIKKVTRV